MDDYLSSHAYLRLLNSKPTSVCCAYNPLTRRTRATGHTPDAAVPPTLLHGVEPARTHKSHPLRVPPLPQRPLPSLRPPQPRLQGARHRQHRHQSRRSPRVADSFDLAISQRRAAACYARRAQALSAERCGGRACSVKTWRDSSKHGALRQSMGRLFNTWRDTPRAHFVERVPGWQTRAPACRAARHSPFIVYATRRAASATYSVSSDARGAG